MHQIKDESDTIAPYVVIAQPRRIKEETPAQNFDGYDNLHVDLHGFSHGYVDIAGEKVDVARNYLMEQALQSGAKYLFFIGEDTVVPMNAFKVLHKTAEENPEAIIAGVYYIKLSDAMIMVRTGDWITIPNVDPGQLLEAWQTGMDCMMIPITVLQKIKDSFPELPFCCIGNNVDGIPFIGEDNFFAHLVHKLGIKILVNTDVQCLHMDIGNGKYTAHPDVDLKNYFTNIPVTERLTIADKKYIDDRWLNRLPEGTSNSKKYQLDDFIKLGYPVKFNMGCGRDKFEGYIGIDKYNDAADIKEDVTKLSLPYSCADEIYASHLIEHIPNFQIPEVLTSWFNILKPEGQLILETPNLEELCKDFETATEQERYMISLCIFGAINTDGKQFENGTASPHLWGFYPKILVEILEKIGFKEITVLPQKGLHPGKNFRIEAKK
jgi:hypothetical protein